MERDHQRRWVACGARRYADKGRAITVGPG